MEQDKRLYISEIMFCGQKMILACDRKCHKAWGINERPKIRKSIDPDDFEWKADHELGLAPAASPITEGDDNKPIQSKEGCYRNKWCARECERSILLKPDEPVDLHKIILHEFSERVGNKPQI